MHTAQHTILLGGGDQPVRFVPTDEEARPLATSGEYRVLDLRLADGSDGYEVVPATPVAADPTATTTTAAAGRSTEYKYRLPVVSVAGFERGRRYLVSSGVAVELVEVAAVDAVGPLLRLTSPLRNNYALGADVIGVELEATFPAAAADSESGFNNGGGPFAVDFEYDGHRRRTLAWVKRHEIPIVVTEGDLDVFDPAIANHLGVLLTPAKAIRAAIRSWSSDLTNAGLDPTTYNSPVALEAISVRALAYLWGSVPGEEGSVSEIRMQRHLERYAHLVNNLKQGLDGKGVVETKRSDQARPRQRRARIGRT